MTIDQEYLYAIQSDYQRYQHKIPLLNGTPGTFEWGFYRHVQEQGSAEIDTPGISWDSSKLVEDEYDDLARSCNPAFWFARPEPSCPHAPARVP